MDTFSYVDLISAKTHIGSIWKFESSRVQYPVRNYLDKRAPEAYLSVANLKEVPMDREDVEKRIDDFQKSASMKQFDLIMCEAHMMGEMMEKADAGDRQAQQFCISFSVWAEAAGEIGAGCWMCKEKIQQGNVAVIAVAIPKEKGGMGLAAVMCGHCRTKTANPQDALDALLESLDESLPSLKCHRVQ